MVTKKSEKEQRKERTAALIEKLTPYVKANQVAAWNDSGFTIWLNANRTAIQIYPGDAIVTVAGSKREHQVVINVKEEAHTVTQAITGLRGTKTEVIKRAEQGERFPVAFENWDDVKFVVDPQSLCFEKDPWSSGDIWDMTVTAHVPESTMCFLAGQDEKSYFISPLKEVVKTVAEAHEALRPASVPEGTLRVGEWFLVPVSEEESARLDKFAKLCDQIEFEEDSNHYAPSGLLVLKGHKNPSWFDGEYRHYHDDDTIYVSGWVLDKEERHSPVWLPDWHLVVRNEEDADLAREVGGGSFD